MAIHEIKIDISKLSESAIEEIAIVLDAEGDNAEAVEILDSAGHDYVWVADDGNADVEMSGETAEEAAYEYVGDGWESSNETQWFDIYTWRRFHLSEGTIDEEDRESHTVTLHPEEPDCTEDEHEYVSPIEVFGGCDSNPGVWGNGGGVIVQQICKHCGLLKTTNTWANHGAIQGLTSITYEPLEDHTYEEAFKDWLWKDGWGDGGGAGY